MLLRQNLHFIQEEVKNKRKFGQEHSIFQSTMYKSPYYINQESRMLCLTQEIKSEFKCLSNQEALSKSEMLKLNISALIFPINNINFYLINKSIPV